MTDSLRLRLYVAGENAQSRDAERNINAMLDRHDLEAGNVLQILNLEQHPEFAVERNILAIPTLERLEPAPSIRVIGSLEDTDKVWQTLTT